MQSIIATSRADAWVKAVTTIIENQDGEVYNLIVEIADGTSSTPADQSAESIVNKFLVTRGSQPLQTVAETIFPASEYRRHGRDGVYSHYPVNVYPAIKEGWGTYAYRILRRKSDANEEYNPLRDCVEKNVLKSLSKSEISSLLRD